MKMHSTIRADACWRKINAFDYFLSFCLNIDGSIYDC